MSAQELLRWHIDAGVDETIADGYAALVKDTAVASSNGTLSAEALAQAMEALLDSANLPRDLTAFGVDAAQLDVLSKEAAQQWTASFNPRDITAADFTGLYQKAFAS